MQGNECKVTIGMPVYNVEDYIVKCLSTSLEQDLDRVEVLIVDDCGTDKTMSIIKQMAKTHPQGNRIRIIKHEKNKGVAEARNTILREAKGKYIYFQDPDDFIEPHTLSILFDTAETNNAQLTYGSMLILERNGEKKPFMILKKTILKGKDALVNFIYSDIHENIPLSSCNILIRTDFIRKNHISFPSIKIGEDLLFNEQIQPLVTSAVLLPNITYIYQKRPNSLMQYQSRDVIDIQEAYGSIKYAELRKQYCNNVKDKSYYDVKCAKTMKHAFYTVCGILNHRHQFNGQIPDKEIRNVMRHPSKLIEIIKFKHQKGTNLTFWLLGILPPSISISLIKIIGKKKGFIR